MSSEPPFTRFVALVDIGDATVQNVQEFASLWGQLENELTEIGIEVVDAYAVLGIIDFLVVFDAPGPEVAFKASIVLERHGFSVQTMVVTPTDEFATLVEDL